MDDLGTKLRELRERLGLQQTAIARQVRKTPKEVKSFGNYLSRLERGDDDVQNPSLDTIEDIARGMGLTLSQFFLHLESQANTHLKLPAETLHTSSQPDKPGEEVDGGGSDTDVQAADLQQIRNGTAILAKAFVGLTARLDHTLRKTRPAGGARSRRSTDRRGNRR